MPAMIRSGGKMWGSDGKQYDCKAVMPESTFARIYQEMINFCKWHGNFDPATMGTVPNVGLIINVGSGLQVGAALYHF